MTPMRLALTELRRLTAGRLPRIALAALVLVPTLYGGLYLYANKDPYGGLRRVPAALVVEDQGTTLADGSRLDAGPTVASDLLASHSFAWHRVSRADALSGVRDDRYDFALVLPRGFSADLASSAQFRPRQAQLQVMTNDANNYLAHTIANNLVAEVTRSVARQVSTSAASQLLLGFSTIHSQLAGAVTGAGKLQAGTRTAAGGGRDLAAGAARLVAGERRLVAGSDRLAGGADRAAQGAHRLSDGTGRLAAGLDTLDRDTAALPGQTRQLADGAQRVADGNAKAAAGVRQLAAGSQQLTTALTSSGGTLAALLRSQGFTDAQVQAVLTATGRVTAPFSAANAQVQASAAQLTALSTGANQVAAGARQLAAGAGPLHQGIHRAAVGAHQAHRGAAALASGLDALRSGAAQLRSGQQSALSGAVALQDGAGRLANGLSALDTGATRLHEGLGRGLKSVPDPSAADRKAVAQTIGDPVAVQNTSQSTAGSYGAGLAPFFLSLALWIGAYVLFLLVKPLSSRALAAGQPSARVALGGLIAPALVGAAQAAVVFSVVVFGLGIRAAHPFGVLGLLLLTSLTFVAIMHALSARFGSIGKFLGLVLLVLQLVSAGGTFPWQTLPIPLHLLHRVLPMSYAIDAMRHVMYGGALSVVGLDVVVLGAYLLAALAFAGLAARRARVWSPARVKPELVL